MMISPRKNRSFVLVLVLLLSAIMLASASGVTAAYLGAGLRDSARVRDLQHELCLDGILALMPIATRNDVPADPFATDSGHIQQYAFGDCTVNWTAMRESTKTVVADQADAQQLRGTLADIARQNSLEEDAIDIRVISNEETANVFGHVLWFDQLVRSRTPDTVHPCSVKDVIAVTEPSSWSEVLTLWSRRGGEILGVLAETEVQGERRRAYMIVELDGRNAIELWRWRR